MASGRLAALCIGAALFCSVSGAQRIARNQACLTLLDASDQHAVSGARVSLSASTTAPGPSPVTITNAAGRACIAGRDSVGLQVDAVGYLPINLALGTGAAPRVMIQQLPDGMMQPAWGGRQFAAALTQALDRPEIARDSVASSVLSAVLLTAQSAPQQSTVTRDSSGVLLLAYVDLAPDGSRYSELRMRYIASQSIVLGVTTTRCGDACAREHDIVLSWAAREGSGWTPDFFARKDSTGAMARVALDASTVGSAPDSVAPPRSVTLRGVVRSDKGALLVGIDVYTADGAVFTVTNAQGEYTLAVPMPPGGALIATRRLGWAPQFRKLSDADGAQVQWSPQLESTTVLATQFVRAAGIPDALQAPRYDNFLARRARGVGQFFMAEEIWSAISLGDVLNRARGFRARFTYGNNLSDIHIPSCTVGAGGIGVFVDGYDQTGIIDFGSARDVNGNKSNAAVNVLTRYVNAAIVGMELYVGRTQLPPEFADPRYCAVISLWTR
jgi:hypothetical protein